MSGAASHTGDNGGLTLSVVIANYNYAAYVGEAIESSLGIDWPRIEVVVVDDGSTDESRAVIDTYRDRVKAIYQSNAGQITARNVGFAASTGDIVILLDSDDVLAPSLMRELAAVWRPGLSKVQFQMRTIGAAGERLGSTLPQYNGVPSAADIRSWAMNAASYPTPPCSGNAYSRAYLERIFPLDDSCGPAPDSCCLAAAPYLGDVVTVAKPLASYRVHGRNDGAMADFDASRFHWQVSVALQRFAYARKMAATVGLSPRGGAPWRSLRLLPYRVSSFRLAREKHPVAGDSVTRIAADAVKGALTPQGMRLQAVAIVLVWSLLVCVAPLGIARTLVHWRFSPGSRPQGLRKLLAKTRIAR